jgi:hypothetical protein
MEQLCSIVIALIADVWRDQSSAVNIPPTLRVVMLWCASCPASRLLGTANPIEAFGALAHTLAADTVG